MAETFELRLLTPERELLHQRVEWVTAEGTLGQFGVLAKHVAFATSLEPGPLSCDTGGGPPRTFAVKGGYAEVLDDVMTVLAEAAVAVEAIDPAGARAGLEEARTKLAAAPYGHPDHERGLRELRWAEILLALAEGERSIRP